MKVPLLLLQGSKKGPEGQKETGKSENGGQKRSGSEVVSILPPTPVSHLGLKYEGRRGSRRVARRHL